MSENRLFIDQIDSLTEAGNIGAGNAVTALSQLLQKPVDMTVSKVNIKNICELGNVLGDEEKYIAAMIIEVLGDINGMLILALEKQSAHALVDTMLGTQTEGQDKFDELEASVLCETGNILAGSYLNALGRLTGLSLIPSVPQMALDMAAAILSFPAIEFTTDDNAMRFIETHFTDNDKLLSGTYILVLDSDAFTRIVDSLEQLI